MIITDEQKMNFLNVKYVIFRDEVKVRDYDHINGLYRGCAHSDCNINFNNKRFLIPMFFYNLKGFDGHLIIQGLTNKNSSNIKIIEQNFEKYMTFSFINFWVLDSFAFMSSLLDTLSSNLLRDGNHNFKHTLNNKLADEQNYLLLCKCVYPYTYMDLNERFEETELPPIDKFYS